MLGFANKKEIALEDYIKTFQSDIDFVKERLIILDLIEKDVDITFSV